MESSSGTVKSSALETSSKKGGGGVSGGRLLIYLTIGSLILAFTVGLIVTIYLAIKYRPRNVYLPSYPLPKSEVYIVMLDEGGLSHLKGNDGNVIKSNTNQNGNPTKYNVKFSTSGTNIQSSSDISLGYFDDKDTSGAITKHGYSNSVVDALKKQAFKYAFGDNKGGEKIKIATRQQVDDALKAGANWGVTVTDFTNPEVYRVSNNAYNELILRNSSNLEWSKYIYAQGDDGENAMFKIESSNQLSATGYKANDVLPDDPKVFAVALFGPKQPPTDFNARQYDLTNTYNSEQAPFSNEGEELLNPVKNFARPTITFRAKVDDLQDDTNLSSGSGSFIFKFRILPFAKGKWSSVYGNDFRSNVAKVTV